MSRHVIVNADYVQEFMKGSDEYEHMRDYMAQMDEVVRCRDCRHYNDWTDTETMEEQKECDLMDAVRDMPDFFCAWGEVRER